MSQVSVKYVDPDCLFRTKGLNATVIPVVPLEALREWLTRFSCVCAHSNINSSQEWDRQHENWCPQLKVQRLLASLGEVEK